MNQPDSDAKEPDIPDERIDQLADQFEKDWKAGGRPRIEDYLNRAGDLNHSALLRELIIVEWDLWLEAGQHPKLSDYLEQFPGDEKVVREVVAFVEARRGEELREDEEQDEPVPNMIERYAVEKELGSGGFAKVFLAHDTELNRPVALKIPLKKYFKDEAAVRLFLQEAQTLASLNHPSLVTVFTCGRLPGGAVFIVQEFINGPNLGQWARSSSLSHKQIVRLLIEVGEAIAYVHQKKIWHRDLKPANILLDVEERPHVADFGLALHERSRLRRRGERSGSPPYMAPEQVHGESHRIDGCTDIWALGVILYELLVRERPFQGADEQEIFKKIVTTDPLPPRQIAPSVPRELERICLKCLQRRRSDRYLSVADLLDDLRHWLEGDPKTGEEAQPAPSEEVKPRIIPKGLRSFDAHDADFFLDLLPGPRDRNGLPESLRFWKTQIEETDPDKTFAVGLIYGPSGCGKSSLVKAGLLPRLDDRVTTVYVEATPHDTEVRLAKGLRKRFPDLPEDLELPELFWHLRTASRRKLLIVLDQFEQWLHVRGSEQPSQLVEALRQCEAGRIQCVVLVRADFMMAITRFLDSLEAGLVKGGNAAAVDLFDPRHARHVLAAFGRAYGTLPENPGEMTKAQSQFLDEAVAELAEDERIICVKLALLAELVKGKPWTPGTIRDLGGFKGIGRKFLEETFESETAVPKHRFHQKAAEAVLRALLPESDTDEIKGSRQSRETLLEATEEYIGRAKEFDDVLQILDTELRLITPTEPEGLDADEERPPTSEPKPRYYQLTHDYLVPSLREWLTRRQKETWRGRAELLLADRAAVWTARQENRQLPSLWQWLQIKTLTRRQTWKPREQKMMAGAGRVHALRSGIAITLIVAITVAVLTLQRDVLRKETHLAVMNLGNAKGEAVPWAIEKLADFPHDMVVKELGERFRDCREGQKLSLAYGLAHFGKMDARFLIDQIPTAASREADNLITAIGESPQDILEMLREAAASAEKEGNWREKARLAITALHLGDPSLAQDMCRLRPDPIRRTIFIDEFPTWHVPAALPALAMEIDDNAFRSGMCLAVGSVPLEEVTVDVKHAWQPIVSGWYETKSDTVTHSASGWMMRQWRLQLPKIAESPQPAEGMEWHVNSIGMTVLKIAAGNFVRRDDEEDAIDQTVTLTQPFLISDREVSRSQFQMFMDDPDCPDTEKPTDWEGVDTTYSPTGDYPVQNLSWYDAALFCNWVSCKDGLGSCYQIKTSLTGDYRVTFVPDAIGYRLPTEAEWEHACRADTVTEWSMADDYSLLAEYAVYFVQRPEICGSQRPNAWGLFDCHGNVCEWCYDLYDGFGAETTVSNPLGPERGLLHTLRGGSFNYDAQGVRSGVRYYDFPVNRHTTRGFRVARSCPSPQ